MPYSFSNKYKLSLGVISEAKKENYGKLEFLSISLFYDYCTQGYPACSTINGFPEQENFFKELFEVDNLTDIKDEPVIIVGSNCDVFALVSLKTKQIFSLQAKFFPEKYQADLDKLKSTKEFNYLNTLNDYDALLTGVLKTLAENSNKIINLKEFPQLSEYVKNDETEHTELKQIVDELLNMRNSHFVLENKLKNTNDHKKVKI